MLRSREIRGPAWGKGMRGPAARILGFALAAASLAAAAPASAAPASSGYEDGLAAYQRNDFDKSLKLLRPLAEKGDARAQYLVGRHYQFGQAVKADRAEAFYWYKRAEAKGHMEAKLFRVLLEKRWKISAAEKGRAEQKIAADNAPPKPAPARTAQIESKPKPRPEPAKPAVAERAKPEPKPEAAKPAIETARAKLPEAPKPEPAKARPEPAKAKAPDKPAIVAARSTPEETTSTAPPAPKPPTVIHGSNETPRVAARPPVRDDDDDDDVPAPRRAETPPPESRTPVAAAPTMPPPRDDDSGTFDAPGYKPMAPGYQPSAPGYAPPPPYYGPGPGPYYAPAAPPSWRATIHYGPSAYYPRHWGYQPYRGGYMHPGWRGMAWRGHRGRW